MSIYIWILGGSCYGLRINIYIHIYSDWMVILLYVCFHTLYSNIWYMQHILLICSCFFLIIKYLQHFFNFFAECLLCYAMLCPLCGHRSFLSSILNDVSIVALYEEYNSEKQINLHLSINILFIEQDARHCLYSYSNKYNNYTY